MQRRGLQVNCGGDGLDQPIKYVRPECPGALEKVAECEDIETNFVGNLF